MKGAPLFFPELLERFMSECENAEHWTTVQEFRTRMSLDKSSAHAIAGFLRRLHDNPSVPGKYTVVRIENFKVDQPYRRIIRRYLVREKTVQRQISPVGIKNLRRVFRNNVKSRQQ